MIFVMPRRATTTLVLALAVGCRLAGCVVSDRDVSHDPAFLIGYRPGQAYELQRPADLLEIDAGHGELLPVGERRAYGRVVATIPAKSVIEIGSLRHTVSAAPVQWETGVETRAAIRGWPTYDIALNDISSVRWVDGDC